MAPLDARTRVLCFEKSVSGDEVEISKGRASQLELIAFAVSGHKLECCVNGIARVSPKHVAEREHRYFRVDCIEIRTLIKSKEVNQYILTFNNNKLVCWGTPIKSSLELTPSEAIDISEVYTRGESKQEEANCILENASPGLPDICIGGTLWRAPVLPTPHEFVSTHSASGIDRVRCSELHRIFKHILAFKLQYCNRTEYRHCSV